MPAWGWQSELATEFEFIIEIRNENQSNVEVKNNSHKKT